MKKISFILVLCLLFTGLFASQTAFAGKKIKKETNTADVNTTAGVENIKDADKAKADEEIVKGSEALAEKKDQTLYSDSVENKNSAENVEE